MVFWELTDAQDPGGAKLLCCNKLLGEMALTDAVVYIKSLHGAFFYRDHPLHPFQNGPSGTPG